MGQRWSSPPKQESQFRPIRPNRALGGRYGFRSMVDGPHPRSYCPLGRAEAAQRLGFLRIRPREAFVKHQQRRVMHVFCRGLPGL